MGRGVFIILGSLSLLIGATLWLNVQPPLVQAAAMGRFEYAGGFIGFSFAVTNRSTKPLEVIVARRGASKSAGGYAYRTQTEVKPSATWNAGLYPPKGSDPWTVDVLYLSPPSKLEATLRGWGAKYKLCAKVKERWRMAQRIVVTNDLPRPTWRTP